MLGIKRIKIHSYEKGLYFRDGEFKGLLSKGKYWFVNPLAKVRVDIVDQRDPWLAHKYLDLIVKSGALSDQATVLNLKDYERALVWIDKRFETILSNGLFVLFYV